MEITSVGAKILVCSLTLHIARIEVLSFVTRSVHAHHQTRNRHTVVLFPTKEDRWKAAR